MAFHLCYSDLVEVQLLVDRGDIHDLLFGVLFAFPYIIFDDLFIGIFITMIPCLLILKAGPHGALAFLINAVEKPYHYFWITGTLSSFLDNAPTYLTFFNTALGSFYAELTEAQAVPLLMTERAIYLQAISAGAVFFGACSYIGNAPNFMVRSIAEEAGTPMPSFLATFLNIRWYSWYRFLYLYRLYSFN